MTIDENNTCMETRAGRKCFFRLHCETVFAANFKESDFSSKDRYKEIRVSLLKLTAALSPSLNSQEEVFSACRIYDALCDFAKKHCSDDFSVVTITDEGES